MSETATTRVLDTILGGSFQTIQSVLKSVQRHDLKLERYRIELIQDDLSVVVLFKEKDTEGSVRRDFGVRQGSTAELDADDLHRLTSNPKQEKVLDALDGSSFLAIRAAVPVFERRSKPDLLQYKITVARAGEFIEVTFTDKESTKGGRGNMGTRPGFWVRLASTDLGVLGSYFIR